MDEPRLLDTTVFRDETGAEVCWRVDGCKHEPFCHRRNLLGEIVETCQHCTYQQDYLVPGGIQEYCSAVNAPLNASAWSALWKKDQK